MAEASMWTFSATLAMLRASHTEINSLKVVKSKSLTGFPPEFQPYFPEELTK
jgi:hypothetical protein